MSSLESGLDHLIFDGAYADTISPLSKAAKAGDLNKIKKLISKNCLPQTPDNRGWTAIHYCVAASQIKALKLILKLKSKNKKHLVNLRTWENITPLMVALKAPRQSLEMVKILLKAGADPKQCTLVKLSPLHLACLRKGNLAVVKLLVEFGADVNIQEEMSLSTPLHFAISETNDIEIFKFLLSYSDLSLKNVHNRTGFLEACNSNFFEAVQIFLEKDKNLAKLNSDIPPIVYAGFVGNLKMAELLISLGADVNCRCKAILSCKSSDSEVILFDREDFLPIHSSLKNIEVFRLMLRLTKPDCLLELETNSFSFPLFVLIFTDEIFYQVLLLSDLPDKLKTFNGQILTKFVVGYPDLEENLIEKFPLLFKYNFDLKSENIFEDFYLQMVNGSCPDLKYFCLLAQIGISQEVDFQIRNCVVNYLESLMIENKGAEYLSTLQKTCHLLSQSVLTLKQYCRIVLRRHFRSLVENDWLALKMIQETNMPDSLKKFLFYEILD